MLMPIKKILCPTDFSDASLVSIEAADQLALHFGAELILLNVISPMPIVRPTGTIPLVVGKRLFRRDAKIGRKVLERPHRKAHLQKGIHTITCSNRTAG